MIEFILYVLINLALVVLLAPLYISLIKKVKARMQGRKGPGLFQTYRNLSKLFKKETIYSHNSSFIMRIAPYINIACTLLAALFVPLLFIPNDYFSFGNIILFLSILTLAKFFMALGGLDAGSTFGGMGSSREMSISSIIEPIIIIFFVAIAFLFNSMNFFQIFSQTSLGLNHIYLWLLFIPIILVFIAETARIPVDNPETHLELTMIHEAMILEQSGKNLALLELSSAIKQLLFMVIIINIFVPLGFSSSLTVIGLLIALGAFLIKSIIFSVGVGVGESYLAKFRLFRLPNLFVLAFFFALITIMLEILL